MTIKREGLGTELEFGVVCQKCGEKGTLVLFVGLTDKDGWQKYKAGLKKKVKEAVKTPG